MILDSTISVEYVGIFSIAIGLHIFKSDGDKIRISNSGGQHLMKNLRKLMDEMAFPAKLMH